MYKNPSGVWLTKALFFETCEVDRGYILFTLKDDDIIRKINGEDKLLPSLKQLYLSSDDPTEYDFYTTNLGGFQHWKELQKCSWFAEHLVEWREEKDARERSRLLKVIRQESRSSDAKSAYQATKLLIDKDLYQTTPSQPKVGRPTTEHIKSEAAKLVKVAEEVDQDFKRLLNDDEDRSSTGSSRS